MKQFISEFKKFVLRGNVLDLAVGVLIGAAFQSVVKSLTDNIISPILGLFFGVNFDYLSLSVLGVEVRYGAFLTSVINFVLMAFVVFLMVTSINKLLALGTKSAKEEAPTTKACPFCCEEISIKATRCPHCTAELPAETQ